MPVRLGGSSASAASSAIIRAWAMAQVDRKGPFHQLNPGACAIAGLQQRSGQAGEEQEDEVVPSPRRAFEQKRTFSSANAARAEVNGFAERPSAACLAGTSRSPNRLPNARSASDHAIDLGRVEPVAPECEVSSRTNIDLGLASQICIDTLKRNAYSWGAIGG